MFFKNTIALKTCKEEFHKVYKPFFFACGQGGDKGIILAGQNCLPLPDKQKKNPQKMILFKYNYVQVENFYIYLNKYSGFQYLLVNSCRRITYFYGINIFLKPFLYAKHNVKVKQGLYYASDCPVFLNKIYPVTCN